MHCLVVHEGLKGRKGEPSIKLWRNRCSVGSSAIIIKWIIRSKCKETPLVYQGKQHRYKRLSKREEWNIHKLFTNVSIEIRHQSQLYQ